MNKNPIKPNSGNFAFCSAIIMLFIAQQTVAMAQPTLITTDVTSNNTTYTSSLTGGAYDNGVIFSIQPTGTLTSTNDVFNYTASNLSSAANYAVGSKGDGRFIMNGGTMNITGYRIIGVNAAGQLNGVTFNVKGTNNVNLHAVALSNGGAGTVLTGSGLLFNLSGTLVRGVIGASGDGKMLIASSTFVTDAGGVDIVGISSGNVTGTNLTMKLYGYGDIGFLATNGTSSVYDSTFTLNGGNETALGASNVGSLVAKGITVNALAPSATNSFGASIFFSGTALIESSTFNIARGTAVAGNATSNPAAFTIRDNIINIGDSSYGVSSVNGVRGYVNSTTITASGSNNSAIYIKGSTTHIEANDTTIVGGTGANFNGVFVDFSGNIALNKVKITSDGVSAAGIKGNIGSGNGFSGTNVDVLVTGSNSNGIVISAGNITMLQSSTIKATGNNSSAIYLSGGTARNIGDVTAVTTGNGAQAVYLTNYANVTGSNMYINTTGTNAQGIAVAGRAYLNLVGGTISTLSNGANTLNITSGTVALDGTTLKTTGFGASGVTANGSSSAPSVFTGSNLTISTTGSNAFGLYALAGGTVGLLAGSTVSTTADGAHGMVIDGAKSFIATDATVKVTTTGTGAHGLVVRNSGSMLIDGSDNNTIAQISVTGQNSAVFNAAGANSKLILQNVSLNSTMAAGANTYGAKAENGGRITFDDGAWSGATTLWSATSGTIAFAGSGSGNGSRLIIDNNGALDIVDSSTGVTIGSLEGIGRVLLGSGTLTIGGNTTAADTASTTYSGTISGAGGALVHQGTGTLTLTASNSHTGGSRVNTGGALVLRNGSSAGTGDLGILAGATAYVSPTVTGNFTLANNSLSDAGLLDINLFAASNTFALAPAADTALFTGTANFRAATYRLENANFTNATILNSASSKIIVGTAAASGSNHVGAYTFNGGVTQFDVSNTGSYAAGWIDTDALTITSGTIQIGAIGPGVYSSLLLQDDTISGAKILITSNAGINGTITALSVIDTAGVPVVFTGSYTSSITQADTTLTPGNTGTVAIGTYLGGDLSQDTHNIYLGGGKLAQLDLQTGRTTVLEGDLPATPPDSYDMKAKIIGSGTLFINATNTIALSGTNTNTGGIIIHQGTLLAATPGNAANALGSGTNTVIYDNTAVASNARLLFNTTATMTQREIVNTNVNATLEAAPGATLTVTASATSANGGAVNINTGGTFNSTGNITYTENTATTNGGAIYMGPAAALNFNTGTISFTNNRAVGSDGGAIYAAGNVNITGGSEAIVFGTNSTAGANARGGAIYAVGNINLMADTIGLLSIRDNTATNGGAIGTGAALTISGSHGTLEIIRNRATSVGGAIWAAATTVNGYYADMLISSNTSTNAGGAIYTANGPLSISATTTGSLSIDSNRSANNNGGALYANGNLTISGSYAKGIAITNNKAITGGALTASGGGNVSITATSSGTLLIADNTAGTAGAIWADGALAIDGTYASIDILRNKASSAGAFRGASITISATAAQLNILNNTASNGNGGALNAGAFNIIGNYGSIVFGTNTVTGGAGNGGAVYAADSITIGATARTLDISGNTASRNGGAFDTDGILVLGGSYGNVTMDSNRAGSSGGALFSAYATTITATTQTGPFVITNNSANGRGGAIYSGSSFNLITAANSTITATNNKAGNNDDTAGGFLYTDSGSMLFDTGNNATATIGNALSVANHTDSISAAAGVNLYKQGNGILTLNAHNTYTGATFINAGKLALNGYIASLETLVATSATLGGTGTTGGNVTIQNSGHLAPGNSPGKLTFNGNLSIDNGANLDWDLGAITNPGHIYQSAANDLVRVDGNITLTGTSYLNVFFSAPVAKGEYDIINYGGALTGNNTNMAIGTVNGASTGDLAKYAIITSETKWIKLAYDMGAYNYWDGANVSGTDWNNGTPDGGNGTWHAPGINAAYTSWTGSDGSNNSEWTDAAFAIFKGDSGTVTVENSGTTINFSGAQFRTDGYLLTGGTLTMTGTDANTQLNIDELVSTTIATTITGTHNLAKEGAGTLTLDGTQTYTGTTIVNAGKLLVDGTLTSAATTNVNTGATLGGDGAINGAVNILAGATLAGGDLGTAGNLHTGTLTLDNAATLAMDLGQAGKVGGPLNDLITTTGDLVLGGTLNITVTPTGSFGGGMYRLIDYTGALTDNTLALGTLPTANTGENYFVQTTIANEVNLFYFGGTTSGTTPYSGPGPQDPNDPGNYNGKVNYWDGLGAKNDGNVAGGNGTWAAFASGSDNWTVQSGTVNAPWQRYNYAMFTENSGTVTVDNTSGPVTMGGASFTVSDYLIQGGGAEGITIGGTASVALDTANTGTTTIASVLTDSGSNIGVTKTGEGTLVLTANNTYTGDTVVDAGKLLVNGTNASGATLNNGVLGGTGALLGAVTVTGGTLTAGDLNTAATLTTGALTLNTGATTLLDMNKTDVKGSGTNDFIDVQGDLALGGKLDITNSSGTFGGGLYHLMDYTGALTGSLALGALPTANTGENYFVQTTIANEVNLFYFGGTTNGTTPYSGPGPQDPNDPSNYNGKVNYWDGLGAKNDGNVAGGNGTWAAFASGSDNWTVQTGTVNAPWQRYNYAMFTATGGTITVDNTSGQVTLGGASFTVSDYLIQSGGAGGIVIGGTASIALDTQTGTTTIAAALTDSGSNIGVTKTGAGTLVLNGKNTYTGTTTISQGKLLDNALISGPAAVNAGLLGGTGTIAGPVNVAATGTLAGGDLGTAGNLHTGALTLANTSVLAMDLGQAGVAGGSLNDLITTTGNLVLGGTLNVTVTPTGSFGGGMYRLIDYTGALTDNTLALGTLPTANTGENYFVQTTVANEVNLFYFGGTTSGTTPYSGPGPQDPNDPTNYNGKVNYWDGLGAKNDGNVAGGNGTWAAFASGSDNWTVQSGTVNAPWQRYNYAMFTATGGTVTVDNTSGQVTLGGADFTVSNYVITGGSIAIGGTANIAINTANTGTTTIHSVLTDTGTKTGVTKTGAGTLILDGQNTYTGTTTVAAGKLIDNGLISGDGNVQSGATLAGTGTIAGSVSVADNATLQPGSNGVGTLTIGGTLALANTANLDFQYGQANVVGGPLNDLIKVGGDLILDGQINITETAGGAFGRGTYRVIDYTGNLTDNTLVIGNFSGTSLFDINQVYVDTTTDKQVNLINLGTANYNWWDGAAVSHVNSGTIDGGDGVWQGSTGNKNWTLSPEADLNAAWKDASIAVFSGSKGTVTVDGSTNGPVNFGGAVFMTDGYLITGDPLHMGGTNANIGMNVNPLVTATVASTISGTQNLLKYNDGTLVLTGTSDYTGATLVNGGKLRVDGKLSGTGAVNVSGTATLAGNGIIHGNVSVADTGTLAPGDTGTAGRLTIDGSLTLAQTSVLDYNLGNADIPGGALNDLTTVGGALTLDGLLNVTQTPTGTFTAGTYRLIDYTGALTNNGLGINSLPTLGTDVGQHAFIQTSVANQVNLIYLGSGTNPSDPTDLNGKVNYWDGSGTANDHVVAGGSGTWQAWGNTTTGDNGKDNWTTQSGSLNAPWQDYNTAIFGGQTSGTVTVDNSKGQVTLGGAEFDLPDYVITGGSIAIGGTSNITINTANTGTTTIDSALTGTSGIIKTGSGTLVLDGQNTYTGTTAIDQGKLIDNGLITGPVVTGSGATLAGTGTILGPVNILCGGTIAPGDHGIVGTLTTGPLTLNPCSVVDMDFGKPNTTGGNLNDLIVTNGDLVLDGTLNVTTSVGGTFGGGIYRIDTYTGTLTNNIMDIGSMPVTNNGENYFIQTSVNGQVNLVFFGTNTGGPNPGNEDPTGLNGRVNYWDGAGKPNDSIIAGGNGTWKAFASGSDNWTTQTGAINAPWQTYNYAMFTATGGHVTVDNGSGQVTLGGADFTVSDYQIQGGGIVIGGTSSIALNTANTGTTTIASTLTGTSGITKLGAGTLVLSGSNAYTGTTAVTAGKLVATNLAATGKAAIATVAQGATLEFNGATGTITQVVTGSGSLDFAKSAVNVASANTAALTNIKQNSVVTASGSTPFSTTGTLTIDSTSRLNLAAQTTRLGDVANTGLLAFAPTANNTSFKTASLASLAGSGTLLFNVDFSKVLEGPNAQLTAADYLTIAGASTGAHKIAISGTNTTVGAEVRSLPLITNLNPGLATANYTLLNGPLAVGLNKFDIMQGDGTQLLPSAATWYLADKGISELGDAIINTAYIGAIDWGMQLDSLHQRMGDVRQETLTRKDGNPDAERVNTQTGNIWMRGRGYRLNALNSLTGNTFKQTAYGVTAGADKAFNGKAGVNLLGGFIDMGSTDRTFVNHGSGSTQNLSVGAYLTILRDSGWFMDLVGRLDRYSHKIESHDVNNLVTRGNYTATSQGLSIEVGKHLQRADGWWVEPILMVSAVWLNGADYNTTPTLRTVHVEINDSMSMTTRAQVRFGRQWKDSKWYPYGKFAAASVEVDSSEIKSGGRTYAMDLDGKRVEFGFGTSYKINDYSQVYFDYEYAKAPHYEKPWSINLGYRRLW